MHDKKALDAVELELHSFMTLLFDGNDQLHAIIALPHRKAPVISTEQETGWA
jgi:hypothetical protein